MLAPPPFRAAAIGGALVLGTGIAAIRVIAGGHFVSDVIFAGVFTFMVVWVIHGLIFRWARTRLSDEVVERVIERIAILGQKLLPICLERSLKSRNESSRHRRLTVQLKSLQYPSPFDNDITDLRSEPIGGGAKPLAYTNINRRRTASTHIQTPQKL
jgi:hypothetical protein